MIDQRELKRWELQNGVREAAARAYEKGLFDAIISDEMRTYGSTTAVTADKITVDDILEVKRVLKEKLEPPSPLVQPDLSPAMQIAGVTIYESPFLPDEEPKITLSSKVDVSANFRDDMDRWLKEMFGTQRVGFVMSGRMYLSPRNLCDLKNDPSIKTYLKYEV